MNRSDVKKIYMRLLREKKNKGSPTLVEIAKVLKISSSTFIWRYGPIKEFEQEAFTSHPELFPAEHRVGRRKSKSLEKILLEYAKFRKQLGKTPSRNELVSMCKTLTRGEVETHFGTIQNCEEHARKAYPEFFDTVPLSHIAVEHSRRNVKELLKSNLILITSAVSDKLVDRDFYEAIQHWKTVTGGKVIILPSHDPASQRSSLGDDLFDPLIQSEFVTRESLSINSNLHISDVFVTAKQLDPTANMEQLAHKEGSSIFASPKQRWRPVSVDDVFKPRMLMTPGAITVNDYTSNLTRAQRLAKFAEINHVLGGMIVEIESDDICYPRIITFDKNDKSFIDMGTKYKKDSVEKVKCRFLKPGDWHAGETDSGVRKAIKDAATFFSPQYITADDLFNGKSISPFNARLSLTQAIIRAKEKVTLNYELQCYMDEANFLRSLAEELIILKSNHDEWLESWLDRGFYQKDPENFEMGNKLISAMLAYGDPFKYAYEEVWGHGPDHNITWLRKDQGFIVDGCEIGRHTHLGPKGTRNPTLQQLKKAYHNIVGGHSHCTEIDGDAIRVGTSSILNPVYTHGSPSDWTQSFAVGYEGGSKQVFFIFNGKWRK